jgi:hypothetical protein
MTSNVYPCQGCPRFIDLDDEAVVAREVTDSVTHTSRQSVSTGPGRYFHAEHYPDGAGWSEQRRGRLRDIIPGR